MVLGAGKSGMRVSMFGTVGVATGTDDCIASVVLIVLGAAAAAVRCSESFTLGALPQQRIGLQLHKFVIFLKGGRSGQCGQQVFGNGLSAVRD